MKKIEINTSFTAFQSVEELPQDVQALMQQAIEIRKNAYAPYSKFRVGAALLLDNGKVVLGSNQENAAYPSGLCAERVAIFHSNAIYPDARIVKMAISAASDTNPTLTPIPPCGGCRQAMSEYEMRHKSNIRVILMGETGKIRVVDSIADLLPFMFKAEELKNA